LRFDKGILGEKSVRVGSLGMRISKNLLSLPRVEAKIKMKKWWGK
jgi:hypothetical protein